MVTPAAVTAAAKKPIQRVEEAKSSREPNLTNICTRWAGQCFFCGDSTAHYAVPVCASWGVWAAWRTEMEIALETEDVNSIEMLKVVCLNNLFTMDLRVNNVLCRAAL